MKRTFEDLREPAARRGEEMLPLLRRLCEVNSYTANVVGVNTVGDLLVQAFDLPGLRVERRAGRGVGDHLFWHTPAWAARPDERVLLVGHHDTVFPPGTFEAWDLEGDRLRGPGVLDMKGGLVVIRTALAALADAGLLADLPVGLVSAADEETSSLDSRPFIEELARGARAALVFESGRMGDAIITRRKGTGRLILEVAGRAAHAGNNHADGINAIWALAKAIDRVAALTDYGRGVTVNVGVVRGGDSVNTVPASAACEADFRYERAADGEALMAATRQIAVETEAATGAKIAVKGGLRRPPLERTEASEALMRAYGACAHAAGLGHGECALLGGGSDAATTSAVGVPSIDGLGPRGKGFHTHDEYIELPSLPQKVEALLRFLLDTP